MWSFSVSFHVLVVLSCVCVCLHCISFPFAVHCRYRAGDWCGVCSAVPCVCEGEKQWWVQLLGSFTGGGQQGSSEWHRFFQLLYSICCPTTTSLTHTIHSLQDDCDRLAKKHSGKIKEMVFSVLELLNSSVVCDFYFSEFSAPFNFNQLFLFQFYQIT